jgi:cell division septation protein DedD
MRPATLILGGNVIAFALGVVVTAWIASTSGSIRFSRAPVVPPAPPALSRAAVMAAPSTSVAPAGVALGQVVATSHVPPNPAPSAALEPVTAPPPASDPISASAAEPPAATALSPPNAPAATVPIVSDALPPKAAWVPPPSATVQAATAASTPSAPAMAGRYILQLGAFRVAANAERLQQTVRRWGFAARIVPQESVGGILDLVQIGGFADRIAAVAGATSLRRQTGIAAFIMKRGVQ